MHRVNRCTHCFGTFCENAGAHVSIGKSRCHQRINRNRAQCFNIDYTEAKLLYQIARENYALLSSTYHGRGVGFGLNG